MDFLLSLRRYEWDVGIVLAWVVEHGFWLCFTVGVGGLLILAFQEELSAVQSEVQARLQRGRPEHHEKEGSHEVFPLLTIRGVEHPLEVMEREIASPESFERLREIWAVARKAMRYVLEVLLLSARELTAQDGAKRVAGQLLMPFLADYQTGIGQVEDRIIQGGKTKRDLYLIEEHFCAVLDAYARAATAWVEVSLGRKEEPRNRVDRHQFFASAEYSGFYQRHITLLDKIESFRGRQDLTFILQRVASNEFFVQRPREPNTWGR